MTPHVRRRHPRTQRVVALVALLAATALLVSCGTSPSTITSIEVLTTSTTAASTTSTAGSTSTTPATTTAISAEDAQAVRDLAFIFWDAYNAYDPDRAISYLDEGYRPVKEAVVRDEIRRIKTFGVTLGMSEKTAPVLTGPDQAEMYLSMKEPVGTRTIWMKFARRSDAWTITYSEEVQ